MIFYRGERKIELKPIAQRFYTKAAKDAEKGWSRGASLAVFATFV